MSGMLSGPNVRFYIIRISESMNVIVITYKPIIKVSLFVFNNLGLLSNGRNYLNDFRLLSLSCYFWLQIGLISLSITLNITFVGL